MEREGRGQFVLGGTVAMVVVRGTPGGGGGESFGERRDLHVGGSRELPSTKSQDKHLHT